MTQYDLVWGSSVQSEMESRKGLAGKRRGLAGNSLAMSRKSSVPNIANLAAAVVLSVACCDLPLALLWFTLSLALLSILARSRLLDAFLGC